MKPSRFNLLVYTFFVVGAVFGLRAQEPAPVAPKPAIVFTALAWDVFDPDEELTLNYMHKRN